MIHMVFKKGILKLGKLVLFWVPKRIVYGKQFRTHYDFISKSQWWCKRKLEAYQLDMLRSFLRYSYERVPYYNKLFKKVGFDVYKFKKTSEIKKIPLLTKEIIKEHFDDLRPTDLNLVDCNYVTTGGSTGVPVGFYLSNDSRKHTLAAEWVHWNNIGYNFGDKCVILRGDFTGDNFCTYDLFNNRLILSTYNMGEKNCEAYFKKINKFKPKVIHGYVSAIYLLAKYLYVNKIEFNEDQSLKVISTTSEMLYPGQKELIEKMFKCKLCDKYGNSESSGIIGMCQCGKYHTFMNYSYLEYLNDLGGDVSNGEKGEIISTNFMNYAFPMIRYKTDDFVILAKTQKCTCGRYSPIVENIVGRLQDQIVTYDDQYISIAAINSHSNIFDHVKSFQYYQDKKGIVELRIVKNHNYTKSDDNAIIKEISNKLNKKVELKLKYVNKIKTTTIGKYRFMVQNLPIRGLL